MKKLNQFQKFDFESFSDGKQYRVTGFSDWNDYDTGEKKGTKVETVIFKDETVYKQNEGEQVSNLFEKLTFKTPSTVKVAVGAFVRPVNPVATVYGEYRNQLSVTCDDLQVLQTKQAAKSDGN